MQAQSHGLIYLPIMILYAHRRSKLLNVKILKEGFQEKNY
jgi:hypothetical protein